MVVGRIERRVVGRGPVEDDLAIHDAEVIADKDIVERAAPRLERAIDEQVEHDSPGSQ